MWQSLPSGELVGYQSLDLYSSLLELDGARGPAGHLSLARLERTRSRARVVPGNDPVRQGLRLPEDRDHGASVECGRASVLSPSRIRGLRAPHEASDHRWARRR